MHFYYRFQVSGTRPLTIPLTLATNPGTLCDICMQSKATTINVAHPQHLEKPLKLVSMDIIGLLHGATGFLHVLIIHDTYSCMIWAWGLTSKGKASQEAAWWLLEVHVATHQKPSEVVLDCRIKEIQVGQGKLWSTAFQELCLLAGVKITASLTQQHTNNAFAKQAIQTIQKIAQSLLYDSKHPLNMVVQPPKGINATPPDQQVLAGDSELHQSYTWLAISDVIDEAKPDNPTPLSLPPYFCQQESRPQSSSSDFSSFGHDWDWMMAEIEDAGEIVMDLDAITADLRAELDMVSSKGGNIQQASTHTDTQENIISVLGSTHTKSPDPLGLLGYTAFATTCSGTQAPTIGTHYLDCMAFAVAVMNGTTLIANGQQLRSTDGILLEPE
ncbi:hypothetical protein NDA14_002149 [Ustilago hordei]|nr:hypothetical protein NDA10_003389 [Ustilago hordei]KAJ1596971.1 hypothetical protein NDA14_002149 [Ustilago hordei]